jgi:ribosome-binding factor A
MKFRKPLRKQILSSCDEIRPDDGVDPRTFFRNPSQKRSNRKALQLCHQIAQTLDQVLGWETGDELLRALTVLSVEPAPDSTRVLVTVCAHPVATSGLACQATGEAACGFDLGGPDTNQILEHLSRAAGRLRTEVAQTIHRKRVPELVFRVVGREEVRP